MLYDLGELEILGSLKFTLRERLREIFYRRGIISARNAAQELSDRRSKRDILRTCSKLTQKRHKSDVKCHHVTSDQD